MNASKILQLQQVQNHLLNVLSKLQAIHGTEISFFSTTAILLLGSIMLEKFVKSRQLIRVTSFNGKQTIKILFGLMMLEINHTKEFLKDTLQLVIIEIIVQMLEAQRL